MAEGAATVMNNFKEQLLLKTIDCNSDTFKVALYSVAIGVTGSATAYTTDNEIVAANYTAGGQDIGTPVVAQDDANNRASWDDDGTNVSWTALATADILQARLYDDTTDPKHVCILWEIATNSNGGDYTLTFNTNGMLLLS